MTADYIDIKGKWGIILCHDIKRLDEYEMRQSMMAFGIRGARLDDAIDVLLYQDNSGMSVSRDDIRMSLVFIGHATSGEQWWDTTAHEVLYHVMVSICDYYDVPYGSEDGAWLTGYLMRQAVHILGEPCR